MYVIVVRELAVECPVLTTLQPHHKREFTRLSVHILDFAIKRGETCLHCNYRKYLN